MDLIRYVRAVFRRWPVVVFLTVLGGAAGWLIGPPASTPASQKDYYRATATLIANRNTQTTQNQSPTNGQQTAFLVTKGDVPQRVADKLGVPLKSIQNRTQGQAFSNLETIEITSVATTSDEAVTLADTYASEMIAKLKDDAKQESDNRRDTVLKRMDDIKKQREDLKAQIATDPPNKTDLEAEDDALFNQQRVVYEQFQQVAQAGEPDSSYTLLQGAAATKITDTEYTARVKEAQAGPKPASSTQDKSNVDPYAPASVGPGPMTRAGMGTILGFLVGIGLTLLLDHFDTRLRFKDDVEEAFGSVVIAEIPPLSREQRGQTEVLAHTAPRSRVAETYRVLRTALLFVAEGTDGGGAARTLLNGDGRARNGAVNGNGYANGQTNGNGNGNGKVNGNGTHDDHEHGDHDHADDPVSVSAASRAKVVLVTSPGPSEGKTTTVANLAATLAEAGKSVLVLNCDYRRPRLHRYLESPTEASSPALPTEIGEVRLVSTIIPGVKMVTGIGEGDHDANPAEIAAYQRRVINLAIDRFDYILLDTAPLLTTNDASELVPDADLVIMVCRSGTTTRQAAERSSELLLRLDAPLLGIVFTGSVDAPSAQYYYYYLDRADGSSKTKSARSRSNGREREPREAAEPVA